MNGTKTLSNNHQSLGIIASRVNTLICAVSSEGYFTELNASWQNVLGWSIEEMLAMPVLSLIHPEDRQKTKAASQKLMNEEEIIEFRNRYQHKSGEYIWLQWSATCCTDLPNVVYMATALVINKTVELEEQISISKDFLNQAEKMAQMGHWRLDIKTNKLVWSDSLYDIHGVTRENFTPELDSAINFYHPEDRPIITSIVDKAIKEGKGWTFNLRIIRADGKIIAVRCIGDISIDSNGKAQNIFGVLQDISNYESLNTRFELLSKVAETSNTGMVICDEFKNVMWINSAFEKLTKYSINELIGKPIGSLLQGAETDASTVTHISSQLSAGKDVDVEILNYNKEGDSYWNHLQISTVKKNQKKTNFIGLQQDITENKRQQENICRNQSMNVIGHLAAGICHDFNNIIAIISGNIQLLNMSNNNPKLSKYIENLEAATDRATNLTKRLNNVSRKSIAKRENMFIDIEIRGICTTLTETFPKSIQLVSDLQTDIAIKCKKDKLLDSIINLILNAKEAIPESGEIIVKTELKEEWEEKLSHVILRPDKNGSFCVITVCDNGVGIAKENINKIFEPFFTTRTNKKNIGLGLSQLLDFANDENIGITINSKEEQGTIVSLWLPNCSV
jgi:PAS domain S-box-containing protein